MPPPRMTKECMLDKIRQFVHDQGRDRPAVILSGKATDCRVGKLSNGNSASGNAQ